MIHNNSQIWSEPFTNTYPFSLICCITCCNSASLALTSCNVIINWLPHNSPTFNSDWMYLKCPISIEGSSEAARINASGELFRIEPNWKVTAFLSLIPGKLIARSLQCNNWHNRVFKESNSVFVFFRVKRRMVDSLGFFEGLSLAFCCRFAFWWLFLRLSYSSDCHYNTVAVSGCLHKRIVLLAEKMKSSSFLFVLLWRRLQSVQRKLLFIYTWTDDKGENLISFLDTHQFYEFIVKRIVFNVQRAESAGHGNMRILR